MNIYSNDNGNDKNVTIDIDELTIFTKQLAILLKLYRQKVYIEDPEHYETLKILENISNKLVSHQYSDIINDPSVIIER